MLDAPDQRLLTNVRPESWVNPEPRPRYHLVIVGGGTAGLGAKVALMECELLGVHVFLGQGSFSGPENVEMNSASLRFSRAVIATGSSPPSGLPFNRLKKTGCLINKTVFNLIHTAPSPGRAGHRPLGLRTGPCLCPPGLTGGHGRPLEPNHDPRGPRGYHPGGPNPQTRGLGPAPGYDGGTGGDKGGEKLLHLRARDAAEVVAMDEILVGAKRDPNVYGLGLEEAGVEYEARAGVRVDDHLHTTNPKMFAADDVCLEHKFTHAADAREWSYKTRCSPPVPA